SDVCSSDLVGVHAPGGAGVGQPGLLLQGERVHVGAQHDRGAGAVAQNPDHTGAADASVDVVPGPVEPLGDPAGGAFFGVGELGVLVQVDVEPLDERADRVA